jgi:hypothetical protein
MRLHAFVEHATIVISLGVRRRRLSTVFQCKVFGMSLVTTGDARVGDTTGPEPARRADDRAVPLALVRAHLRLVPGGGTSRRHGAPIGDHDDPSDPLTAA